MKENNKSRYGTLLTSLIKSKGISQQNFYDRLGIRKPYFYDIVSGKANPPPPETQMKILEILKPKNIEKKLLLEIAAQERDEMPADILLYLKENSQIIEKIRNSENYKKFINKGVK